MTEDKPDTTIKNTEEISKSYDALNKKEKITVFHHLYYSNDISYITDQITASRSTVHNWIDKMHNAGLLEKQGFSYPFTEKGELVLTHLLTLDDDLTELKKQSVRSQLDELGELTGEDISQELLQEILEEKQETANPDVHAGEVMKTPSLAGGTGTGAASIIQGSDEASEPDTEQGSDEQQTIPVRPHSSFIFKNDAAKDFQTDSETVVTEVPEELKGNILKPDLTIHKYSEAIAFECRNCDEPQGMKLTFMNLRDLEHVKSIITNPCVNCGESNVIDLENVEIEGIDGSISKKERSSIEQTEAQEDLS